MKPTPAEAAEIMRWGHQHRRLLREKYRRQFVAYSVTRLLTGSENFCLPY
jgi:hypothetical protein